EPGKPHGEGLLVPDAGAPQEVDERRLAYTESTGRDRQLARENDERNERHRVPEAERHVERSCEQVIRSDRRHVIEQREKEHARRRRDDGFPRAVAENRLEQGHAPGEKRGDRSPPQPEEKNDADRGESETERQGLEVFRTRVHG